VTSGALAARVTRRSRTSFWYALRLLPPAKRQAMFALYSFCRAVDDCVDEPDGAGAAGLDEWLREIERCYAGRPVSELGRELAAAVGAFPVPRACFEEIVAGCRMDLHVTRYAARDDLLVYCRRVASAVGLASIEIFGYREPGTRDYAVELGLALQLTNILRDVGADAARGRLYLPLDELRRFGLDPDELVARAAAAWRAGRDGAHLPALRELLSHQAERARERYARAEAVLPAVDRRAMLSAQVMAAGYHALLDELQRRAFPFAPKVRLSRPRQVLVALGAAWRGRRA
jgi:phytoene synthase